MAVPPQYFPVRGRTLQIWPDHHVQWGVPRKPWTSDIEDPALHHGRIQHAFPLGHDEMAVCGFAPPLLRAFIGPPQPLLALAGPGNPRCERCARAVVPAPPFVPHVSPYAPPATRYDGCTWLDDRLAALGIDRRPRPQEGYRPAVGYRIDPPWPSEDRRLLTLGPGTMSRRITVHDGAHDGRRTDEDLRRQMTEGPFDLRARLAGDAA